MERILHEILYRLEAMENRFQPAHATHTQHCRTYADAVTGQQQQIRQPLLPTPKGPLLPTPPPPPQQHRKQPLLPTPPSPPPPVQQQAQQWITVPARRPQPRPQQHSGQQHPKPTQQPRRQQQATNRPHLQQQTKQRRHQQPQTTNKAQPSHTSDNPSFAPLLKMLYRGTQLRHHANNWKTLPAPVERRIEQLFEFLTPPVPTEELKAQLDSQKASLKHDLRTTILTHINTQTDINTHNLKQTTLDESDREAARTLAERVLRKGYGQKASKQHLSQWLAADLEVVGRGSTGQTAQTSSSSSSTTATTAEIQTCVASDSNEDAMDQTLTSRKRRRDSKESPVPVSNRFTILAEEPTGTGEGANPADTDPKKILTPTNPTNKKQNITNNDGDETVDDGAGETVTDAEFDDAETWSMTSSQCDQILTSQPSSNPPDRPNVQQKQNVFVHEGQTKSQWRMIIQNSPVTVLLTDSNFRLAANIVIPDDWEVHVFPGCALIHTSKLLKTAEIPTCVKNIVLAVGINNRGWNYTKSVKPDWNKMLTQSRLMKATVHFLGISTTSPCETIKTINEEGRKQFGGKFIPALPEDQVTISPTDPYRIHHDKVTVGKIIDSIKIHLN